MGPWYIMTCPFQSFAVSRGGGGGIRRNEAAIEICMHDVTDFRRPYTVLESTTAESKTSLFSYFVHGIFFPGIEILTLHCLEFSSPLLAK